MRVDDAILAVVAAVVLTALVVGLFAGMLSATGRADRAERELDRLRGIEGKKKR